MQPLTIAFIFLAIAAVLFVIELFVPSGGIISLVGAFFLCVAVIVSFFAGILAGVYFLTGTTFGVIIGLFLFFKVWPLTPMGQRIVMPPLREHEVIDQNQRAILHDQIGKSGIAKSAMLPSGLVVIENETFDAVSEGLPVSQRDEIEVIAVRTNRLIVRKIDRGRSSNPQTKSEATDDMLSRPIDSLGLDPLDDPLA